MDDIRLINIKEEILSENKGLADKLRQRLSREKILMLNVMGSPGAGKTSLIMKTIESLKSKYRIGVIEADIDSMVDSKMVKRLDVPVVQMHTGGFCHVDANMTEKAIESLPLNKLDLVILENVGNLVCPAETDTGAHLNIAILSIPEGDDKPLKYPLMFSVSDVLIISKIDYMEMSDFDMDILKKRVHVLNKDFPIYPLSCKTGNGLEDWLDWLEQKL